MPSLSLSSRSSMSSVMRVKGSSADETAVSLWICGLDFIIVIVATFVDVVGGEVGRGEGGMARSQ